MNSARRRRVFGISHKSCTGGYRQSRQPSPSIHTHLSSMTALILLTLLSFNATLVSAAGEDTGSANTEQQSDDVCAAPTPYVSETEAGGDKIYRSHAIAMHGEAKYAADFQHFDYVNPEAPTGGRLTIGARGTFDSFNQFIDKGAATSTGAIESLTIASHDEAFTQYGLLAEEIEWPEDRSWVTFYLRPEARWHDGEPVTADDVIWTFDTLREKGQPFYQYYYSSVSKAEKIDDLTVKFSFSDNTNRELPLIMGQLAVLPKHYWADKDFTKATLEPPLGSGPYRVKTFTAGRSVTLERVEDYWGRDLAVRKGHNNFDEKHVKYYRDDTAIRLALKGGGLDYRVENQAKAWSTGYEIPAVEKGWLNKKRFDTESPEGMQAFIVNLRRPQFADQRVRRALDLVFDFEWSNKNLFFDQYTRSYSFWSNSELAATEAPQGEELTIMEHYRDCVPEAVFGKPYEAPVTDGKGWPRDKFVEASKLLEEAGYEVRDFVLVNSDSGEPFAFELLYSSTTFERIFLPYVRNLKRLGIEAKLRLVDTSQFINRIRAFDYDMIFNGWPQSYSPGNEQRDYFSSAAADNPASRNFPGIRNPVIDQLIELVIQAPSRESLVVRTRALDRVLLANQYMIPGWHMPATRILWWNKFGIPDVLPKDGPSVDSWWYDADKAARLEAAKKDDTSLTAVDGDDASTELSAQQSTDAGTPGWITIVAVFAGLIILAWLLMRTATRANLSDAATRRRL